jgi:hypothetical protein
MKTTKSSYKAQTLAMFPNARLERCAHLTYKICLTEAQGSPISGEYGSHRSIKDAWKYAALIDAPEALKKQQA